jgi:hypothetical protein
MLSANQEECRGSDRHGDPGYSNVAARMVEGKTMNERTYTPEMSAQEAANDLDPIDQTSGDDEEDTRLLKSMAQRAQAYLASFPWCAVILDGWFGGGVGGIFAIFLFHTVPADPDVDEWLWVMNGDLPCTYLAFDDAPSVKDAFKMCVDGMLPWVSYAKSGLPEPEDVPPIDLEPTRENAAEVERRIISLQRILGPAFS